MAPKPIPVRLDDEMIAWLDAQAKKRNMSRSGFIRLLLARVKAGTP